MADHDLVQAQPPDAAVVARLLSEFNAEFETDTPPLEELTPRFAAMIARADVLVLLSGARDDPTGFAFLTLRPTPYWDGPLAQLEELYVRPALRGRGIGSALLVEAVRWARAATAGELHIGVDEVDVDARRFYERHGFSNFEPGEDYRMLLYLRTL